MGNAGTGFLIIQNGGQVSTADGVIGPHGIGTATVTGPESRWMIEGSLGRLVVGTFGTGFLEIADGGQVSSAFGNIGTNSNVKVTGSNSAWVGLSRLDMKQNGSLKIESQGRVTSNQGHLLDESNVTVTGAGATWNSSIFLELRNKASLTIESQGSVRSTVAFVYEESRIELAPGSASTLQLGVSAPPVPPGSQNSRVSIGGTFGELRLQGGTVQTEELEITSAATGRGQLRGNGYVTGLVSTLPQGTLEPIQGLRNGGLITADGEYRNAPDNWSDPLARLGKAQLWIDGNLVQESQGTLEVTITDDNRANLGLPNRIPIRVQGFAQLNGKLKVSHFEISTGENILEVGDRFDLMEWGGFGGRFQEFSGAVIPDRDDLFFGLQYSQRGLDLIAIETPKRPQDSSRLTKNGVRSNNSATGIVFVAHGWASESGSIGANDAHVWKPTIALGEPLWAEGDWEGVVFDWRQQADTLLPWEAAIRANDMGENVGFWMDEAGLQYDNAHSRRSALTITSKHRPVYLRTVRTESLP